MFRSRNMLAGLGLGLALAAASPLAADAETPTDNIVAEGRTYVYLQAPANDVQPLLPAGWTVNPLAAGPAKDANLIMLFIDRKLALQPDGTPLGGGMGRVLVVFVPGKNAEGEGRTFVVAGVSADPTGTPGPYGVYTPGTVELQRSESAAADLTKTVDETWVVTGDNGSVTANIQFISGVPVLSTFESKIYSGSDPSFYRIYRGQLAADVVRSRANSIDRAAAAEITAAGAFAMANDAPIVAITSMPLYQRLTFLP